MAIKNRMKTEPIPVVRQHRPVKVRSFTTFDPGKRVPVVAFGLLQGDSASGRLSVAVEMHETHEVLFNRVFARFSAWFIPGPANERFKRNVAFYERSAEGEPITDEEGAETIPFIQTHNFPDGGNPLYRALGIAAKTGTAISTCYIEGYNQVVNYVNRNLSKSITERAVTDTTLAPAVWGASTFSEIVPNFDSGMIAGELPLTIMAAKMPVKGIGLAGAVQTAGTGLSSRESTPADATYARGWIAEGSGGALGSAEAQLAIKANGATNHPDIYVEMAQGGTMVSLANIDQARELKNWARMREQYEGHKDPYIIDRLMGGLEISNQAWFFPMLLDQKMVEIKQLKRMATDGASLEEGVANGIAVTSLGINVPPNPYGGVVMVLAEAIPEQLYERQADAYLTTIDRTKLPQYDADFLNPMPVVEVLNREIDVDHDSPTVRFGYARRNWQWAQNPTRLGGDMYAPNADAATTKERMVVYPTDVENPTLTAEFYLSTTLGKSVFVDTDKEPFRCGIGGVIDVMGLTIIGEVHESEANYDEVRAKYPPLQGDA